MHSGSYHTDQKEMILKFFQKNKDISVSASDIINSLAVDGKKIGLATIYRHLDNLEANGIIRKFVSETENKASWQYTGGSEECHSHYHLKCEGCGKIIHLECGFMADFDYHIHKDHNFTMNRAKTVFYGLCENCI